MWRIIDPLKFDPIIEPPRANDAIIAVTEEMMEDILQLPEDIEITGIYPDPIRRALLFRVRSARFPRSSEGDELYTYRHTTTQRELGEVDDPAGHRPTTNITYNFENTPQFTLTSANINTEPEG